MIHGYRSDCPLCRLTQDREVLTPVHFETPSIIIVDCLVCRVPMAVLKSHQPNFHPDQQQMVRLLMADLLKRAASKLSPNPDEAAALTLNERLVRSMFPQWHYSGPIEWVIDWEQRQIPDHPHCHLRPFPFPGTDKWERL